MKQRKHAAIIAAKALIAVALVLPTWTGYAEDSLDSQLSNVQTQMEQQAANKAEAQGRINDFSAQLKIVQDELAQAESELKAIEAQRIKKEADIKENERLIKEAQERLDRRLKILNKRVRDIYINGKLSYFDVILGAKDFGDFANRVELLKRIINADLDLIHAIQEEKRVIEEKKAILVADHAKIVDLQKEAEAKKAIIVTKQQEKAALLAKAQTDWAVAEAAYRELEASSNAIREQIRARQAATAAAGGSAAAGYVQGTGSLGWPLNGPITSSFGYRVHPIFGRVIGHTGIDIGIDEGTLVHAADGGTVVGAGWYSGYGYTVVIDHGNGMSTLYAHNSAVNVSEGQSVSKGQVVAYSGNTGNSTGPHLHFEVRVNGDPVDPMGYL